MKINAVDPGKNVIASWHITFCSKLKPFTVFQLLCNFIDTCVHFIREAGLMSVYNTMEVATELITKEAVCNSVRPTNAGISPTLYILCMILTHRIVKKPNQNITKIQQPNKKNQHIICCALLLFNSSNGLVFKHAAAEISRGTCKNYCVVVRHL